jgi:hypothetical protein
LVSSLHQSDGDSRIHFVDNLVSHRAEKQLWDGAQPARAHNHLMAVQFHRALGDHIGGMANEYMRPIINAAFF